LFNWRYINILIHSFIHSFPDNRFITDNNLAYTKPAVINDKEHYVWTENTAWMLYEECTDVAAWLMSF